VLSTSGLRALKLPVDVRDVIVLADGDDPGEAAARDCAWRWKREGRFLVSTDDYIYMRGTRVCERDPCVA
jgi:hypothetical protein